MAPGGQHLGQWPGGSHHLQVHLPVSTSLSSAGGLAGGNVGGMRLQEAAGRKDQVEEKGEPGCLSWLSEASQLPANCKNPNPPLTKPLL